MQNERELCIEAILAKMREGEWPAIIPPVYPTRQPDCPDLMDVINAALGEASPETVDRVKAHLPSCDYCMSCFAVYQKFAQNEDVIEPDPTDSMWDEMVSGLDNLLVDEPQPAAENASSTSTTSETSVDASARSYIERAKAQVQSFLTRSPSYIERVRRREPDAVMKELTDIADFLLPDFDMGIEDKDVLLSIAWSDIKEGKPIDIWAEMPDWLTKTWIIKHAKT